MLRLQTRMVPTQSYLNDGILDLCFYHSVEIMGKDWSNYHILL